MSPSRRPSLAAGVEALFPGYFAMVMATGIVAIAARQQDMEWLSQGLYVICAVAYLVLGALLIARVVMFRDRFAADLTSHAKGFAFLTTVAGTNVLGSASVVVHGWWGLAWALWLVGLALLVVLLYSTLVAVVIKSPKPGLGTGINGTWFLLTVSIESVVVLGALIFDRHHGDALAFGLLAGFCLGLVLYLIVMTMVFLRWTFSKLDPTEADPPAWIAGGAVAITVLAGSNLLGTRGLSERIERLAPFVEGIVVLAWATATFWFPLMIAIGVWRHVISKVPLRYHPSYWALVFPLGMYSVATFKMLGAVELDGLSWLPRVAGMVAVLAWATTFGGLLAQPVRSLRRP